MLHIPILRIKNLRQRCYRIQTKTTKTNKDIKKEEMKQTFSRGLKKFPDTSSSFGKLCTGGVKNDAVVD